MEKHLLIIKQYNLLAGDRIVVPKSSVQWIQHHVIFLGWMQGDYWLIENKDGFGVRTITARDFFNENKEITRVEEFKPRRDYDRSDLIKYALSLRNKPYRLVGYNCEDFCNEVQHGKTGSPQVRLAVGAGLLALLLYAAFKSK